MFDIADPTEVFAITPVERAARNHDYIPTAPGVYSQPDDDAPTYGLAECLPDGELALDAEHAAAEPALLTDTALLDTIVAFDHLTRWAQAHRTRLIAEFARRRPGDEPQAVTCPRPSVASRWAPDELGLALGISRPAASTELAQSIILTRTLPDTLNAWQAGTIDAGQARVLCELLTVLSPEQARQVQDRVLPAAGTQTWTQFRAAVRRALLRVDPDGANRRHGAAHRERRVALHHDEDGMSSLWALLSATDAATGWHTLTRLARSLGPDDPRPMDARRADLLVDLITGRLTHTHYDDTDDTDDDTATDDTDDDTATDNTDDDDRHRRHRRRHRHRHSADGDGTATDDATATDFTNTDPGATQPTTPTTLADPGAAAGGVDAVAGAYADDTDAAAPPTAATDTGTGTGHRTPDTDTDTDTETGGDTRGARRPDRRPAGWPPRTNPARRRAGRPCTCGATTGSSSNGGGGKPLMQIVIGLDTLTGTHQLPAELVGYGPIPADLARHTATDAVWKRLITDPVSGALLDHGRRTYRPPAALHDYVKARDVTCRFPICNRRAIDCDLDHLQPWAETATPTRPTCTASAPNTTR